MNHSIKIKRARALAPALPKADEAIEGSISNHLRDRLTAAELAEVRRCLNVHWHKAFAHREAEILADGCIWSPSANRLLEIR